MDLIERYVHEVGRHLPGRIRDDVQAELRSLLTDTLEERARVAGRPVNEGLTVEVLREFGKPEKVAERYLPEPGYLIGPALFPVFLVIARWSLIGLAAVMLFWVVAGELMLPSRLPSFLQWRGVVAFFGEYLRLAFANLALLVLVFVVIERITARKPIKEAAEAWDPCKLPTVKDPERISPRGLVFKVYAIVILFLVFNFFPQWFGLVVITDEGFSSVPFFALGLRIPVLLLNIWWVLALVLNVVLLRQGRWNRETRWVEFGLGLYGAVILFLTLAGSTFTWMESEWLAEPGWTAPPHLVEIARSGLPGLGRIIRWILSAALVIVLIESAVRLYRILTRYPLVFLHESLRAWFRPWR